MGEPPSPTATTTMNNDPRSVTELMIAITEAIEEGNFRSIENLERVCSGWMQSTYETDAQINMLRAIQELMA